MEPDLIEPRMTPSLVRAGAAETADPVWPQVAAAEAAEAMRQLPTRRFALCTGAAALLEQLRGALAGAAQSCSCDTLRRYWLRDRRRSSTDID